MENEEWTECDEKLWQLGRKYVNLQRELRESQRENSSLIDKIKDLESE